MNNYYYIENSTPQHNYSKDIKELQNTIEKAVDKIEDTKDRVDISLKEYNHLIECKEDLNRLKEFIDILPLPLKWFDFGKTEWQYREELVCESFNFDRWNYGMIRLDIPINNEVFYETGMIPREFSKKTKEIERKKGR